MTRIAKERRNTMSGKFRIVTVLVVLGALLAATAPRRASRGRAAPPSPARETASASERLAEVASPEI